MDCLIRHSDIREFVYPISRYEVYLKVQLANTPDTKVSIVYWNQFTPDDKQVKTFENYEIHGKSQYYYVIVKTNDVSKYMKYYITIEQHLHKEYYSPIGITSTIPTRFFFFPDVNERDVFKTPAWAVGNVGYQIFVDRFYRNGTTTLRNYANWGDEPTRENFFGGNLKGIIKKIPYLQELGIKLLYITPIFKSVSNHKYDTTDYFDIDPNFGSKEDLKELVKTAHDAGIKVLLDGVFNHIGYSSPQFQDVIENGVSSPYYKWFYVDGDSVDTNQINYECVGYYKWMPKLRHKVKEVREFICDIGTYWIHVCDIDGWRLDVADEVDYTLWTEFREIVKSQGKDVLLIGETWRNGYDLLGSTQLDSVMNYRLRDILLDFLIDHQIDIETFHHRIEQLYFDYPKQSHNVLYNLLGSHDTLRILTKCDNDIQSLRLLLLIQFLLPGIPFIYYGDEIGLTGENDPLCRKTMDWTKVGNDVYQVYQEVMHLRQSNVVFQKGDFKHIYIHEHIYAFIREYEEHVAIVLINLNGNDVSLNQVVPLQHGTIQLTGTVRKRDYLVIQK